LTSADAEATILEVPLEFLSFNILFYAHDAAADPKGEVAAQRLRTLWEEDRGVLSLQVLQEFFVNAVKKLPAPNAVAMAREVVRAYRVWLREPTTAETLLHGSEAMKLAQLSFWGGMIVAAAEQAGARRLLSEVLQHGQVIAGVRIENPFI
jgi:predicted nucleic acid-binding protein